MPKRRPYNQFCPIARTLDVVGDRWLLPVVRELHLGPLRYTDLQRALPGIGTDVLADRLRQLEATGLIEKAAGGGYQLTNNGRSLGPLLREMARWGGGRLETTEIPDRPNPRLGLEAIILNAEPDPDRNSARLDMSKTFQCNARTVHPGTGRGATAIVAKRANHSAGMRSTEGRRGRARARSTGRAQRRSSVVYPSSPVTPFTPILSMKARSSNGSVENC